MSAKDTIRDLLPPLIIKTYRKLSRFQRTYKTFDDALEACSGSAGYEDPGLIAVIVQETKDYVLSLNETRHVSADQTILNTLLPFSFISENSVNILDVGGSCGMHYFPIKKLLGQKLKLNWHVTETRSLSAAARIFENEELRFFSGINDAVNGFDKTDIVISSGAIQYFADPRAALKEIIKTGAKYILLTRLSLSLSDHDIISVQKSMLSQNSFERLPPGFTDRVINYPHTNMAEKDFKKIISTDYEIKMQFEDNSGIQPVNFNKCIGYGLLLQRK